MDRKKRIIIFSKAILLFVLEFVCVTIAASIQDTLDRKYVNIIGLSSFVFWGLSAFFLIKNYKNMILSEMNEMAEKMHKEANYFSVISLNENPKTLEERFAKSGFKFQQGYLHKRQFSLAKDYINYYVAIAYEENILEYFDIFIRKIDDLFQNQSHFHKNNVVYIWFAGQKYFRKNSAQNKMYLGVICRLKGCYSSRK